MVLFTNTSFIGVDPTAGKRPIVYAALDSELHLLALGKGDLDQVLAFIAGHQQAYVAVCSPRRPGKRVMEIPEIREQISPVPRPGRWTKFRLAEYQLRKRHISIHQTPVEEQDCPNWMKVGFNLYSRLEGLGYQYFPAHESRHQLLEVYPHACYTVLLGLVPFPKSTLEGRIQRQLVLYDQQLNVPDPMRLFEEITRYRLLKGILPVEHLYSPGELDALVGAYTACIAATRPEQTTLIGHPDEGLVVLPCAELKMHY
jgi:Protein of unknown function (DUF429)